jgi:hypothetical protein
MYISSRTVSTLAIASLFLPTAAAQVTVVKYVEEQPAEAAADAGPATEPGESLLGDCCGLQEECDQCCQPRCFCCCCPGWIASADVLFLRRSRAASQTLVRDQVAGTEILNSKDLRFDYQAAPRIQLLRDYACCKGWGLGYFGLDSWNTSETSGGVVSPAYEMPGFLLPSTGPGTIFRTNYGTDLQSIEVNHRTLWNECLTLLAGFRWIELQDELRVDQIAPVTSEILRVDADNHMYGFQIGADASLINCGGRFHIDGIVRAAILYNRADQNTFAPIVSGIDGFVDTLSADDDHTAFFGELGLVGVYWLTPRIAVRGGYQLMWLEGVALAPEQIPVNNLIAPAIAAVDTSGSLFLDGATVGFVVQY